MLGKLSNIFWLGIKELRSLQRDAILAVFVVYSFTLAIYTQATGSTADVNNASVAFIDEDRSALTARFANALTEPSFQKPELINADEMNAAMDNGRFMFVVSIPPDFERNVIERRQPELQLNIDATAMSQAGVGAGYLQSILNDETSRFALQTDATAQPQTTLVARRAFNPNGDPVWFGSLIALINQVTMLTIVLTGAALIREREHGTIEHLLVMPLTSFDIAVAKVWANGLVILVAVVISVIGVIQMALHVPIAGSRLLFFTGTGLYLFFATALGIFLGTVTRTMAQFAMLIILIIIALQMLSGGSTPVESQPAWLQAVTWFLPTRHFVSSSQAIIYRGAGFNLVWREFLNVGGMGLVFFTISLLMFRRSITVSR